MTLGTRYAAEASKRLSICPGRTCGFAAEISVGLTEPELQRATDNLDEDGAARAVVLGFLARDAF